MAFYLVFFVGTGALAWSKLMPACLQALRHGTPPQGRGPLGLTARGTTVCLRRPVGTRELVLD